MKALFMQRLVDRGCPVSQLWRWFAGVDPFCRVSVLCRPLEGRERRSSQPPVLVLPNGQFQMTANIASVLHRVYAAYKQHPAVATNFGGSSVRLIVAYCKTRFFGACLFRARH
jgi:hypothetical protein